MADPEATFPKPLRNDGGEPCGECHIKAGETCDICGATPMADPRAATCLACAGNGWVGPFWTSLESADAIDRMSEREKKRLSTVCPVCVGTGKDASNG
jgi:hypothetical protein